MQMTPSILTRSRMEIFCLSSEVNQFVLGTKDSRPFTIDLSLGMLPRLI